MGPPYLPTVTPYGYNTPPRPYVLGALVFYYDSIPQPSFPPMLKAQWPVMFRPPPRPQLVPTTAIGTRPIMSRAMTRGPTIQPRNLNLDLAQAQDANAGETSNLRKSREDHEGHRSDQLNADTPPEGHPMKGQGEIQATTQHNDSTCHEDGNDRHDARADQESVQQRTRERISRRDITKDRHERRGRTHRREMRHA